MLVYDQFLKCEETLFIQCWYTLIMCISHFLILHETSWHKLNASLLTQINYSPHQPQREGRRGLYDINTAVPLLIAYTRLQDKPYSCTCFFLDFKIIFWRVARSFNTWGVVVSRLTVRHLLALFSSATNQAALRTKASELDIADSVHALFLSIHFSRPTVLSVNS